MSSLFPKPGVVIESRGESALVTGLPVELVDCCRSTDGFWYFDPFLETRRPPTVYGTLAARAVKHVWAWDPYVHEADASALSVLNDGISFRVLTEGHCTSKSSAWRRIAAFTAAFRGRFPRVGLQVRAFDRSKYQHDPSLTFHDRYLFVDDSVYVIGASLSYHQKRIGATAVTRVDGASARDLIRRAFDHYWSHHKFTHIFE